MIFGSFVDKLVKNENINKIMSFFLGLGFLGYSLIIIIFVIKKKSELIVPGFNNIYYTIPLFLLFFYYQKHLFKKFIDAPTDELDKPRLGYKKFSINLALFIYIIILPIYLIFFSDVKMSWSIVEIIQLFFGFFLGIFMAAGGIFAFLIYFLRMGVIISGINLCIGLHNYFNGQEFDIVPMYSVLAEFALPEYIGILITILQISLAIYAGKIEDLFS